MQKNKIDVVKTVCISAVKKLVVLSLAVAVGGSIVASAQISEEDAARQLKKKIYEFCLIDLEKARAEKGQQFDESLKKSSENRLRLEEMFQRYDKIKREIAEIQLTAAEKRRQGLFLEAENLERVAYHLRNAANNLWDDIGNLGSDYFDLHSGVCRNSIDLDALHEQVRALRMEICRIERRESGIAGVAHENIRPLQMLMPNAVNLPGQPQSIEEENEEDDDYSEDYENTIERIPEDGTNEELQAEDLTEITINTPRLRVLTPNTVSLSEQTVQQSQNIELESVDEEGIIISDLTVQQPQHQSSSFSFNRISEWFRNLFSSRGGFYTQGYSKLKGD